MARALRRLTRLFGPKRHAHVECRRCGTTIDTRSLACPECGSHDIASYEL